MKRLILLAIVFATTLSLSAQRNMQVWEGDSYSEFFTGNVDSVTFLLSPEGTLRTYATPQFKIENDYWFVSYDEGSHWTQLGKATGEQGPQGEKGEKGDQGEKGDKGDSMFLSVTQDDKFIYLLMSDSTKVQIAKSSSNDEEFDKTVIDNLVNSLTIDKKVVILHSIGQKDTIISTTMPFPTSKVIWTSSDDSIVSIEQGVVQALQEGYVTITAQAGTCSQQCKVYVVLEQNRGFSVSDTSKVLFAPGNLQYNAAEKIWRFATHPYETMGVYNTIRTPLSSNWIDLFSLGCNGYQWQPYERGRAYYRPNADYGNTNYVVYEFSKTDYDFGWYNKISNGGNTEHTWRMFTYDEMNYLLTKRKNAENLVVHSVYNGVSGILILPDNFEKPTIMNSLGTINDEDWQILSAYGAVFLPNTGMYDFNTNTFSSIGTKMGCSGGGSSCKEDAYYWCSSLITGRLSLFHFSSAHAITGLVDGAVMTGYKRTEPGYGLAVRLVKDLK